jgi:hypothetical protein
MNNTTHHVIATNFGVDYEKEYDPATRRGLYIPVVIDDRGKRHRLEQLGCRKAQTALEVAQSARAEVLAKLAEDAKVEAEVKRASVDAAVLAAVA